MIKNKVMLLRLKWEKIVSKKIDKLIKQYEDSKITKEVLEKYYFNLIKDI
jgi:hypothetical protein